jgi:hypothetical protein
MFHSSLRITCLLTLVACGSKTTATDEPCGEGMGRADDGECYPLAGYGDDAGTTTDTGETGAGSGDGGAGDGGSGDGGSGDGGSGDGGSGDGGSGDAGSGDAGSGDGGSASGSGSGSGTGGGDRITISGVITFEDTTASGANCNITSWVAEAVDETSGQPDRSSYSEDGIEFIDCSNHPGGDIEYEVSIQVDTTTEAAFFAFVDPDGDASTTDFRGAAEDNPYTIEAGGTYTDVNFFVPAVLE